MPTRWIPYGKVLVHVLCLLPFLGLLEQFRSGAFGMMADPVSVITHQTGDWAMYLLLGSLAVTPLRRLHPRLGNLIGFRRILGLYAFFYGTLHLGTYVFLFSGYDLPSVASGVRAGHAGAIFDEWRRVWPTMLGDMKKRRFIQVGLIAWLILLPLALTSPGIVMGWMGGKNWQRLHRLVYVAAMLAVVHFWWLVKTGVLRPWKDTAVLALLLAARVVWVIVKRFRAANSRPPATAMN